MFTFPSWRCVKKLIAYCGEYLHFAFKCLSRFVSYDLFGKIFIILTFPLSHESDHEIENFPVKENHFDLMFTCSQSFCCV